MGDFPAARDMQEDLLARYRRILGEDHPDTHLVAEDLAASLADMGHYQQARQMRKDVLTNRRRILGDNHPDTLRAKRALDQMIGQLE